MSGFRSRWLEKPAGERQKATDKTDRTDATPANSSGGQEHGPDKTDKTFREDGFVGSVGSVLSARAKNAADDPAFPPSFGNPTAWPPECLESLRRFHRPPVLVAPHAILFPLLGKRVQTPRGPGLLLAARLDGCQVTLDSDPSRAVMVDWQEVRPL